MLAISLVSLKSVRLYLIETTVIRVDEQFTCWNTWLTYAYMKYQRHVVVMTKHIYSPGPCGAGFGCGFEQSNQ